MNVNPAYRTQELRYALNLVEVKALIVADKFRNQSLQEMLKELIPSQPEKCSENLEISSPMLPSLKRLIVLSDQVQISGYPLFK